MVRKRVNGFNSKSNQSVGFSTKLSPLEKVCFQGNNRLNRIRKAKDTKEYFLAWDNARNKGNFSTEELRAILYDEPLHFNKRIYGRNFDDYSNVLGDRS